MPEIRFSPLHGQACHCPWLLPEDTVSLRSSQTVAATNTMGEYPLGIRQAACFMQTLYTPPSLRLHGLCQQNKTGHRDHMSDFRNGSQHVVGGMPGQLALGQFYHYLGPTIILDSLGDLSGPQLYVHKKRFVWLYGLKEHSSSIFYDLGIGYGFH